MAMRHWGPVETRSNKGCCLGRRHCCHSIHCNPITPHPPSVYYAYYTTLGGAEYTSGEGSAVFLSNAEVLLRSSAVVGFARSALAGAAVGRSVRLALAWQEAAVGLLGSLGLHG